MMGIEKHLEKEKTKTTTDAPLIPVIKAIKGTRGDIDDEDDEESYYRYEPHQFKFKFKFFYGFIKFVKKLYGRKSHGWCCG